MPRDGSGIYSQPFPDVVEGTTIESAVYNGFTHDIEIDLNTPRPISSGGTGANNAADAMSALGGEGSKIEVLNYDSHAFTAGSFYSKASATNPPVAAHAFAGICYVAVVSGVATSDMFIEVRDRDEATQPGSLYVRQKKNGTWSGWLKAVGTSMSGTPPAAPTDGMFWWDPTRGKLFVWYSDPNTAQWVEAVAMPDMNPDDFVRIDAPQTLTPTQQTQARQNIYAAPFDALAYNGMQINGSFDVSQERGFGVVRSTNGPICDGWHLYFSGTMVVTAAAAANVDTIAYGLPNIVFLAASTAQTSLGASDQAVLLQNIEGYRVARLAWGTTNAQPITIGFWSCHQRTGIYSVSIHNAAANRNYSTTYTHNGSGVWQYNSVTIPGDTTGTWAKDNTAGLQLMFGMAGGTSLTAPSANTWIAGIYVAAPGQINGVAATSDVFRITGVVVLPGIEAPSAARSPLIMRPYDQELVTCQRYYRRIGGGLFADILVEGYSAGAGQAVATTIPLSPVMRSSPSTSVFGTFTNVNASGINFTASASSFGFQVVAAAAGHVRCISNLNGGISCDARL